MGSMYRQRMHSAVIAFDSLQPTPLVCMSSQNVVGYRSSSPTISWFPIHRTTRWAFYSHPEDVSRKPESPHLRCLV